MEPEWIVVLAATAFLVVIVLLRLRNPVPGPGNGNRPKRRRRHLFMKTPDAWAGRARLLLERNRPDLARALLEDALEQFPGEPRLEKLRRQAAQDLEEGQDRPSR